MKIDYLEGLRQCGIQDVHLCRPKEKARNCPNCGELCWDSELNFSSTRRIDCDNGSIISTLYGVCLKCAGRHDA